MIALMPGMRVEVRFGNASVEGTILEDRSDRALVQVIQSSTTLLVDKNVIVVIDKPQDTPEEPKPVFKQKASTNGEGLNGRKSIESLRFGLVPFYALEDLTVGLDEIQKWIESRLPGETSSRATVSEICGQYGTGKSHMMALIRQLAKKKNYVTAHVEINGKDVTLEDPDMLSTHLWKTVEAENLSSDTPVLDIYIRAIESGAMTSSISFIPRSHRISDNFHTIRMLRKKGVLDNFSYDYNCVLSCSNEITAAELYRKICADPSIRSRIDRPRVTKLIGRSVMFRGREFANNLLGFAEICKLAGFNGLVITIDEFEVQRLVPKWERVVDVISSLAKELKGGTSLLSSPIGIFFAAVGLDGHVGDKIIDWLINECGGEFYPLKRFEKDACIELGNKIFRLYRDVYEIQADWNESIARKMYEKLENQDGHVRAFIKNFIARLDKWHGPTARI